VGRAESLDDLCNYLKSPGIHPIVVGERGIGKTSLVKGALQRIHAARTSILEVNTVDSFDECCKHICDDLSLPYDNEVFTPAAFLRALKQSQVFAVVSVDELDDLQKDSAVLKAFATFAKAASNHASELQVKFIFSGIGSDAHDIFKGHLSTERNLPQIRLEEIKSDDLREFIDRASSLLQTEIPNHIREAIVNEADGFPYYLHQVGFHMLAAFSRDDDAKTLSDIHLVEGRKRALNAAFAHYLRRYKFTIYQLSDVERLTLESFLRTERRRISVSELQEESALRASASKDGVLDAMRSLYKKDYLVHRKADGTVALKDALLKPFLRERLGIARSRTAQRKPSKPPDDQMNLI
jgi:hypothetical protein